MADRTRARALARQFVDAGSPLDWFEVLYHEAAAGTAAIPWADLRPNPNLVEWLDRRRVTGDGRQALIVGCGYGDDAEELVRRGSGQMPWPLMRDELAGFSLSLQSLTSCLRLVSPEFLRERFAAHGFTEVESVHVTSLGGKSFRVQTFAAAPPRDAEHSARRN